MAGIREFKKKIKSATNIAKITKTMQMIAASKMKNAQSMAQSSRDYSDGISEFSSILSRFLDPSFHPLLSNKISKTDRELIVVIAPEKGLCGSLLTNLHREFRTIYKDSAVETEFITVGKKAKNIIKRTNGRIVAEFSLGFSQPSYNIVPPIAKVITESYLSGRISKVRILFTQFLTTMTQMPSQRILLPLNLIDVGVSEISEKHSSPLYVFEPSAEKITNSILKMYVEMEIYQILLESFASEQSARMIAMKNATDNANEIIGELTLLYNVARQSQITSEILDIGTATMALE